MTFEELLGIDLSALESMSDEELSARLSEFIPKSRPTSDSKTIPVRLHTKSNSLPGTRRIGSNASPRPSAQQNLDLAIARAAKLAASLGIDLNKP